MKVLLLNGSPHEHGCTFTALSEVAKTLNAEGIETEFFWIGTKPISGCIVCGSCVKTGSCPLDNIVNTFVKRANECDGLIIGSPVYYAGINGTLKALLDRAFYSGSRFNDGKVFAHKPAAAIVSARRAGTTDSYDQIIKYFGINQMPIVSSVYWNMVHGKVPENVLKDEEGMQVMRVLAKNMAYLLKCQEAGEKSGVKKPEQEKKIYTNFIR